MKNQKTNWWLDAILFTGFILTFLTDLTGVEIHQWIGIAIGAIILVHLTFHWNWVVAVVNRFFGNTSWRTRINLLVDSTLVGGFLMITFTGLLISTWLNLTFVSYDLLKNIHILTSVITLFLVLLKIVLHRKWIINIAEKYIFPGNERIINPLPVQFQPTKAQVNRRDFLKIGGVVAAASLPGISQLVKLAKFAGEGYEKVLTDQTTKTASDQQLASLDSVPDGLAQKNNAISQAITQSTTVPTTLVQSQTDSTCNIRCNKKCSFPGRCGKYRDSNGNDKCDLGECV